MPTPAPARKYSDLSPPPVFPAHAHRNSLQLVLESSPSYGCRCPPPAARRGISRWPVRRSGYRDRDTTPIVNLAIPRRVPNPLHTRCCHRIFETPAGPAATLPAILEKYVLALLRGASTLPCRTAPASLADTCSD